jgi:2-oxoglutarate ferredoxin oxidoreductase subunit gamma
MDQRFEMRFTGSGGQGVILASIILAEAAVLSDLQAVQSQSYGPEARGGLCKAETILSRSPIWFSKVIRPDFLLALTQSSLNRFAPDLAENAVVMIDSGLALPASLNPRQVLALPILQTAKETTGRAMTANIVAVGAIHAALGLFSGETLEKAVMRHIPAGTEALNLKALEAGEKLVPSRIAARFRQEIA